MKDTRKLAEEYRLSHWAEILRSRVSSGLSITAYCAQEGMHPNKYYYWQRKLRTAAASSVISPESESNSVVPSGWSQLLAESPAESGIKSELRIEIGKCVIRVDQGTDIALLRKICKGLVTELC
jgi:transposase-like protein